MYTFYRGAPHTFYRGLMHASVIPAFSYVLLAIVLTLAVAGGVAMLSLRRGAARHPSS